MFVLHSLSSFRAFRSFVQFLCNEAEDKKVVHRNEFATFHSFQIDSFDDA